VYNWKILFSENPDLSIDFTGLYPAFLTPRDQNLKFAPAVAEQLLHHLMQFNFAGTYIAGSTGEGLRMSVDQRKELLQTLMPVLPPGKKMIVHVGAADVHDSIALAEHAAKHGAHAISSLPPDSDSAGVHDFYRELAQQSVLPLILYYFPKVAPRAFSDPQELIDICELPNVIGVKFTDFNFYLLQRLVKRGNLVFNGYDEALAAGLLMGAQGGIGSTYNLMPGVYEKIFQATQGGDWETARFWQSRSNAVLEILLRYPFFPALREAMRHLGFDCGPLLSGESLGSSSEREALLSDLDREMPKEIVELMEWPSGARSL
jgi:N-acetylneuraminate lyase